MKKLTLLLCFVSFLTKAQNITVASGKSFTIEKTGSVTMSGNFSNAGTFTLNSDSDEFSSIIIGGTVTGNITYNRYVNPVGTNEWDLIGSPVDGQSISCICFSKFFNISVLAVIFTLLVHMIMQPILGQTIPLLLLDLQVTLIEEEATKWLLLVVEQVF